MVNLTINGQKVQAEQGTYVLEAARKAGIELPTMCYNPELTPYGGCRLCSVELKKNGRSWVTTSCNYPVEEGLEVNTESERAVATRKLMGELLLARCPKVPAVQRMAASVGVKETRFGADNEEQDCVLCGLCVRACHEIAKKDVIGFVDRGPERKVTSPWEAAYKECDTCNQCIPYCPTGAITRLPGLEIGAALHKTSVKNRHTRQIVQYAALAVFLIFMGLSSFLPAGWAQSPLNFVNLFARLDPLQAITAMIASRSLIVLYLPAIITIALTLIFGRVWCGWFCPLGAIFELFGPIGRTGKVPQGFRQAKYWILGIILIMAAGGSLAFMFFDPITILVRGLANTVDPLIRQPFIGGLQIGLIGLVSFLPLLVVLLLNLVEKRFWCRYLCPLGAIVGLGSKISWINRRVDKFSCVDCGDCSKACGMGAINVADASHDPAECVMCLDCATVCRKEAIDFKKSDKKPVQKWNWEFDPTRREFIGSAVAGAAAVGVFTLVPQATHQKADFIRPPGVIGAVNSSSGKGDADAEFLKKCIRCGQCVEACATKALHPAQNGMGWDALWSPAANYHLGYCSYDCNRCGQVCPAGAIPALTLDEKRKQKMGLAVIDLKTCIKCNKCVDNCPYEAVEGIFKSNGEKDFPVVHADKCMGCGTCQFVCPAPTLTSDLKAIKVWSLTSDQAKQA